jgi:hypothetical protein
MIGSAAISMAFAQRTVVLVRILAAGTGIPRTVAQQAAAAVGTS